MAKVRVQDPISYAQERRAYFTATRQTCRKYHRQISELTVIRNELEADIPALERRLVKMKETLPRSIERLNQLKLSYGKQKEVYKKQERLADLATKREKAFIELKKLENEILESEIQEAREE